VSPSLFSRISNFARSPQGRRLTRKAQRLARDPATRRKVDEVRRRLMKRGRPR
jgi:hypothetical protein